MTQICVLNSSTTLANNDVNFLVEACATQLFEFCKAWNLDPWAVGFYASAAGLPADDIYIFEYVDQLDVDGALAYHSVDALGRPYGRMLSPSDKLNATGLSHEIVETRGDEDCDKWMKMPNGSEIAVEVADPVQGDATTYLVAATVLGETRQIKVSDYVLPSFFDAAGLAPYDRQGAVAAPFGMAPEGYEALLDPSGNEHDVFARLAGNASEAAHKMHDSGSRLMKRLRGRP